MTETDGLSECAGVFIIGATNRADLLDPALLRPGRFEIVLTLGLPDREDRTAILRLHLRGRSLAPDVDPEALAALTPEWSGAELVALCRRAAYHALEEHLAQPGGEKPPAIRQRDLTAAFQDLVKARARGDSRAG